MIERPLLPDYTQDIDDLIEVTNRNYRDVGMVYICNPNNPTGVIVPGDDIRRLLDGIPEDVPVLIDEAYHHFIEDPRYETAVPYIKEGRKVLVTRTFSKIYGLAGMRLGYGIAPPDMIDQMRDYATGSVNALVKWGGVAALEDKEYEAWIKETSNTLRDQTADVLQGPGLSRCSRRRRTSSWSARDGRRPRSGPSSASTRWPWAATSRPCSTGCGSRSGRKTR